LCLKSDSPTDLLKTGVTPQTIQNRVHPYEPERAIIHRFVHPGERLIVLAETGVYDRDIERAPIYSSRAFEQNSQYPSRLVRTTTSAKHIAEERLGVWACSSRDPLYFRDRLWPHLLLPVALGGDCGGPVDRWLD
jgi:hypothetical protein